MSDQLQPLTSTRADAGHDGVGDEVDIRRLLNTVYGGRWWIIGITVVALLLGYLYLAITPYTYSADALLKIQSTQNAPMGGMSSDAALLFGGRQSTAKSEIPIITSREVLGKTVRDLSLAIKSHPKYLPVIGHAFADKNAKVVVSRFDVPDGLIGKPFQLKFKSATQYQLIGPSGQTITNGTIGKAASGEMQAGQAVALYVRSVTASDWPATFTVSKGGWLSEVSSLQNKLGVKETPKESGVLNITLQGQNQRKITAIVNSVAQNYVNQNVEARSQHAAQSLEFLKGQLPKVKSKVNVAETKLANYQEQHQTVDLSAQAQALLGQATSLEDKRSKLKLKIAELSSQYTSAYPEVQAARDQLAQLRQQSERLEKNINKLPDAQKQMLGLQRDVKVNTELYTALLNRAQELRIAKAGTVGNVRIVDKAVEPVDAIAPRSRLVLLLSLILGGIVGVGFVLLRAALRRGIDDPKEIETRLGLPVYAVVPFSTWLSRQSGRARRRREQVPILARDNAEDVASEALRTLRTSLYFAQMDAGSNVILMTGPSPGVGKSFVSMNLAYLLSEAGQSVVVVDGDMRKGRLHEFLSGRRRDPGLSQVLTGQASLSDALRRLDDSKVSILTSGQIPPNPSELLMREAFPQMVEELRQRFDLVLVDAPPILAVTDAAVIAASVPGIVTFMVAGAGMHPVAELEESVKRLSRGDYKVAGVVFNAYQHKHAEYAGGYNYYQYEYKS